MEENIKLKTKESHGYKEFLRETMMWLITRPDKLEYNAIKCAIQNGASEFLQEILNTKDVFRFDDNRKDNALFDVTNFTQATYHDSQILVNPLSDSRRRDYSQEFKFLASRQGMLLEMMTFHKQSSKSYLEDLVRRQRVWREMDIPKKQPIRRLIEPYICFMRIWYCVIAVLHLIYMICFSHYFIPTTSSLIELFHLNASDPSCESTAAGNSSDTDRENSHSYPSWIWLLWPVYVYISYILKLLILYSMNRINPLITIDIYKILTKCRWRLNFKRYFLILLDILYGPIINLIFCALVFFWYKEYGARTNYCLYLKMTSNVLLCGWITGFISFSEIFPKLWVFTRVLRNIIFKDIALSFIVVFIFTLFAFSFAMHVLSLMALPSDDSVYLSVTVYDVFAAALGAGDYFEKARDQRLRSGIYFEYLELVIIAYICVTAIILLNVLIAMVNHRYTKAKQRADNYWRLSMIEDALILESFPVFRRLIVKHLRLDDKNRLKVRLR